jgi:Lrp/AsnC family leucine-responsive transcriptional regulator
MPPSGLDETDRQILDLLQRDARITNAAIGEVVGMTAPSVYDRVRKLEARGVIQRYTVVVDPAALGKTLTAFIRLTVAYDERHDAGMAAVSGDPDVLECYSVAGEDCFIIKTRVGDPGELQALINRIRAKVTILRSVTMIVLAPIKETQAINVLNETPKATRAARSKNGKRS